MTKTEAKNNAEQIDPTKSMTKEAIGIWSEETGEEAKRGDFPESLDLTKHQNEAFRCKFIQKDEYEYQVGKDKRQGIAYVAELIKTSAKECKELEGKQISIYGKGLLNHQFKQLKVKEGDIFVVSCGEKQDIGGGKEAYQTSLKVVKRA